MPTPRIENLNTERIAQIMRVALEEFGKNDYHSSSFNRIIRSSGMSKGTMYYYFESKEDLFITLLNASKKEFFRFGQIQIHDVKTPSEFWERIEKVLEYIFKELNSKQSLGLFIQGLLVYEK